MTKIESLEDAIKEFNEANPKTELQKEIAVPTLSFKTMQSDSGEIIDPDNWQTETVTFKIYDEARLAGSYLTVRRSRQIDTGYELVILRHQYIDGDHGWCVGKIDMTSESEGIEIKRSGAKKITAEEAVKIINAKTHWLRIRNGTKLEMPAVQTFNMER